jgi:preprotein translocase subunit SecG
MPVYLNIAMIIISILLIALIIIGARNSAVGNVFGGDSPVYHARRGLERALFNATVWVSVIFFVLAILSALVAGTPQS